MHINVGDLVSIRKNADNDPENNCLGIVVKKSNRIQGLDKSTHLQHIMSSYAPVFYVCEAGGECHGPFQSSELLLQQPYSKE